MKHPSRLKPLMILAGLVAGLVLVGAIVLRPAGKPAPQKATAPNPATIFVKPTGFEPATVVIKKGATVTWDVEDEAHPSHWIEADPYPNPDPTSLSSGRLMDEGKFSYKFNQAGTIHFHDRMDPTWTGTITVQ